ncbi:flavonol sulfotransferase-like [Euphorbia lathyris]|uniref:flavonol sulfotransferase-like n=1 Tax=Euphorbia lathyris TaxID=212925 RepID=UPI0033136D5B
MDTLTSNLSVNASVTDESSAKDIEINISTLPQESGWRVSLNLYKYQGFWYHSNFLEGIILFQKNFIPQPNDILLCSLPKSGTTWLKSLSVAISTRSNFIATDHPNSSSNLLLTNLPHDIVPFQEMLYSVGLERDIQNPLIATHVPFNSLPKSILNSNTKIIYVCRNPKDVLVSLWHFSCNKQSEIIKFEEAYEKFCNGVSGYGPYWDHVLGYWKASLEFPDRLLFLKYEELKNDTYFYAKKIADFMGCPFSVDEEKQGIVEKIVKLCSFESLKNFEVNKSKNTSKYIPMKIENNLFFRKGEIDDWKNYLTVEMAERLDQIIQEKFSGSGLNV